MNNSELIVDKVIKKLLDKHLSDYEDLDLESSFIGKDSYIESIDIVGSITFLEEELDKYELSNIDLFEAVFDKEEMTFRQLLILLIDLINIK